MSDGNPKCWSTNVKSNLYLFKEALPTFNANPEGGSFIITSSTAVRGSTYLSDRAQVLTCNIRLSPPPGVAWRIPLARQQVGLPVLEKFAPFDSGTGLHLMKCLAQTQGSKARVNAVLPGLLLTDWVC